MPSAKIKRSVVEVLEEARQPLKFSEIKAKVEHKIGTTISKGSLGNALASLLEEGVIKKQLKNGTVVYHLSEQYEKEELRNILLRHIESAPLTDLECEFEDIPTVVIVTPRQKTIFEEEDAPTGALYFTPQWTEPSLGISSVILNDFLKLPKNVQNGIVKLLFWCYWAAIKGIYHPAKVPVPVHPAFPEIRIEKEMPSMIEFFNRNIEFTREMLKKAEESGNKERVEVEKSVLEILTITEKLFAAESLLHFLSIAEENEPFIAYHEKVILKNLGHWVHGGERLFHSFVREPGKQIICKLPLEREEDRKLLNTSVFNEFCRVILYKFKDVAAEVKGSFEHAMEQIALHKSYLNDLLSLFRQRRFIVVHFFNIPTNRVEEKNIILPAFQEWLNALREGKLKDHSWLFKEKTIKFVEKVYRRVRRKQPPPPVPFGLQFWTVRDIYELHPRGKDPKFWLELLELLRFQKQPPQPPPPTSSTNL